MNRLIVASAGSGKTRTLIEESMASSDKRVLITTFTINNANELRRRFYDNVGYLPSHIDVENWFTLLLKHGARPYQGKLLDERIAGIQLVNGKSAIGIRKSDIANYYFSPNRNVYTDKLAEFVLKCNDVNNGAVIDRLSRIYSDIYIDEVQDLAGYDLDFLKLLIDSPINILLVGDPRQGTYATNKAQRNKQYRKSKIVNFFDDPSIDIEPDYEKLKFNYRSTQEICDVSNKLYPDLPQAISAVTYPDTEHQGFFMVHPADVQGYLENYKPLQLRRNINTVLVDDRYRAMNYGKSKGLETDHVLIYPMKPFLKWFIDDANMLKPTTKCQLYVALTRARKSVAIIYDHKEEMPLSGFEPYFP